MKLTLKQILEEHWPRWDVSEDDILPALRRVVEESCKALCAGCASDMPYCELPEWRQWHVRDATRGRVSHCVAWAIRQRWEAQR